MAGSRILAVGTLQPAYHFGIDFLRRGETDLDGHRVMNLRRLQSSAGLHAIDSQADIDAIFRRRLYPGERSPLRNERDVGLPRLDRDVSEACGGLDHRIEDRTELRSIRVLPVDELVRGSREEVRIAESLHHEETLGVACHAVLRQPSA